MINPEIISLTRDETRRVVYKINSLGVSLSLKDGRISAQTAPGQPLDYEAARLLRAHREEITLYLQTPPEDKNSHCAACGRAGVWTLDPVGVWVCACYFQPELRTWPKVEQASLF